MNLNKSHLATATKLAEKVQKELFDRVEKMNFKKGTPQVDMDIAYDRADCIETELHNFLESLEDYIESGDYEKVEMTHFLSVYDIAGIQPLNDIVARYNQIGDQV